MKNNYTSVALHCINNSQRVAETQIKVNKPYNRSLYSKIYSTLNIQYPISKTQQSEPIMNQFHLSMLFANLHYFKLFQIVLISFSLILFSGCSILPQKPNTLISNQPLTEIKYWTAKGKIMFTDGNEKHSANFYWQQQQQDFTLQLTNLLGLQILSLSQIGNTATMTFDGDTFTDVSAEQLIIDKLQQVIPVSAFSQLLLNNIPEEAILKGKEQYQLNYNGMSWLVSYLSFQQHQQYRLPKLLTIDSSPQRIKLSISSWQLYPNK